MSDSEQVERLSEARTPYLTHEERSAVERLLVQLSTVADQIERVILFGSKARGDLHAGSDVDLLVVTRNGQDQVKALTDHLDCAGIALTILVKSADEYRRDQQALTPLYVNVRRDGVELWDLAREIAEEGAVPLNLREGEWREMKPETRALIQTYLGLANTGLTEARVLRDQNLWRAANSRAYYAVHYAAVAALYAIGVVRGKHSTVEAALNEFLVKPRLIEPEFGDIHRRLRQRREDSDYRPDFAPSAAETTGIIRDAERFVARIEQLLREHGALNK
jgi:uncharacterized protein (UPF0332 family)/predicted nucleotidyltransferase